MVTLDKIVKNVGEFDGDISNHRTYERAKENIEVVDSDAGMQKLEETLRKETGYNDFRLPQSPDLYTVRRGEITFSVRSETTTKRPQYKKAVEQMENYIGGINLLLFEGRVITGIAKENDVWCISADTLLENYEVVLAGVKSPGVKQTITYEADLSSVSVPDQIDMNLSGNGNINHTNFVDYVVKDLMRTESANYVAAYEKALKKNNKIAGVVPVNTRKGYKEETIKSEGVNWAYVAKTLVNSDPKYLGELNVLADESIPFNDKVAMMPQYDLFLREPFGETKVYIGLQSLYQRLQDLKDDKSITAQTTKFVSKEIV